MPKEVSPRDPRIQRALQLLEEEEAAQRPEEIQALRLSYERLLAAYLPIIENPGALDDAKDTLAPGEIAREVNADLAKFGHDTLRLVHPETLKPVAWKNRQPQGPRLDLLATHRHTGFTSVWQFDNRVPLRDKVDGVNMLSPAPDLALFILCNIAWPLPEEKLALACRDVTCDFLVFWIAEAGKILTPVERDFILLELEDQPKEAAPEI